MSEQPITRFSDHLCGVCRRRDHGFGYVPKLKRNAPILWICDDPDCIKISKDTYQMRQNEFDRYEASACLEAGVSGGEFLIQIGKGFDLEKLDPSEYDEFVQRIIAAYRVALKVKLMDAEAPF